MILKEKENILVIPGKFEICILHVICLCCSCASRNDLLEACDSRNLDILQKEFPL